MKHFFLVLMLTIFSLGLTAQESYQDVVYLKNGSIIKGTIIEQVPNESIKIQTADGSIFVYKMSEILKMTKEMTNVSRQNSFSFKKKQLSFKDIAGYRGFLDFGYSFGTSDYKSDRLELSTSHGYQFNPYLFIGGGVGIHYHTDADLFFMPIFVHARANFLKNDITPFFDFKIGYSVFDGMGFYLSPAIGCSFNMGEGNNRLFFMLGYSMQKAEIEYYRYTENVNLGAFSLKVGFEF